MGKRKHIGDELATSSLLGGMLTEWNKHFFGHIGKQISELQKKLQLLENMRGGESVLEDIYAMKKELNKRLNVEEDMWHQQSQNNWLRAGDKKLSST